MSGTQNTEVARKFIRMCNEGKLDELKDLVHPDVIWHGMEEINGLADFRQSMLDDQKFFPDMQFTIVDELEQDNKVVIRWTVKATHKGGFMGLPPIHEEFETHGVDIYHFESGKIKEGWEVFDALTPALEFGAVEVVQPKELKQ